MAAPTGPVFSPAVLPPPDRPGVRGHLSLVVRRPPGRYDVSGNPPPRPEAIVLSLKQPGGPQNARRPWPPPTPVPRLFGKTKITKAGTLAIRAVILTEYPAPLL